MNTKNFIGKQPRGNEIFGKNLFMGILIFSLILGASGLTSAEVETMPDAEFCGLSTNASCMSNADCHTGGCSGQVCSGINESVDTTCEWLDCYDDVKYNVSCGCFNNICRWNEILTQTQEECICNSCGDCETKLNNNSCKVVKLMQDIINQIGNCIDNSANFSNKIFDCQGHTIDGDDSDSDFGIYLMDKQNNTIKNCTINGFYGGIYLYNSSNNTLTINTVNNNTNYGIYLFSSLNNNLINNTANNNYNGIYLDFSSNNTLTNNTVNHNNDRGIYLYSSSNNTLTNNTANNNLDGIYLYSSSNNTLINNTVNNLTRGISLFSSKNNILTNNTANNNNLGIYLRESSNNVLTDNTLCNNSYGIYFYYSSNFNNISNNKISNNTQGITLSGCNTMGWAECLGGSSNNTFEENEISNNNIGIFSNQSNSTISNNYVCGNTNLDFNSNDWLSSSGDNNTCDKAYGWNDDGKVGCAHTCYETECKFGYYLSRTIRKEFDYEISDVKIYDIDKDGTGEIITTTTEYNRQSCGNSTMKILKNYYGNLVEIRNTTIEGNIVFTFSDIDNDNKSEIIVESTCRNYYDRDISRYKIYVFDDSTLNFTKITEIDLKIYAPDLIFTGINFSKANISHNDNITITLKILNNGSTNAVNARVELNIINNLKNFYHVITYPNVSAHTETTTEFNWTATFGKNEIYGEIDSKNELVEINESNNKIYANLTVIDSNPPHISVISPANNSIINGNLLEFGITDDIGVDKVRYAINNGNFNNLPYPYYITTTNLSSGKYNLVIVANDTSGNSANATFAFIVDSTPPGVKFSMPEHIYINESANIEIPADVDDNSAIKEVYAEIYFDNAVSQISLNYDERSGTWKGNFEGKVGYYSVKIVAIDALGNINDSEIAEFDISKILNTTIENSTIIASIIENSELKNSEIIASVVKDSFLNYTNVNLSEIEMVSSENSKFESSVLFKCISINSTIIKTDLKSSRMLGNVLLVYPTFVNATIVDGKLINGSIIDSGAINAANVGAKVGAKIGATVRAKSGTKIGTKVGAIVVTKIGAKISAKIGAKIGAKPILIIADTDKDNKKEILTVMNQIYVFEDDGNNNFIKTWNSNTINGIISEILINDSDNDGNLEIIASTYNKIYIFENTGDNSYTETFTYSGIGRISNLIVDDLNNDGKNEILFGDSGGIHVLENNGDKFSEISNYTLNADNLQVDDLNNDGKKEIIYYKTIWIYDGCMYGYYHYSCGHYEITIGILGNDGSNHYNLLSNLSIPEYVLISGMFFEDLNNNGIKEILIAGSKFYILESTGNNSYVRTCDFGNEIGNVQKILFEDVDNDSKKELVVLSRDYYYYVGYSYQTKSKISVYEINKCGGIFVSKTAERQRYSWGEEFNYTIIVKAKNFTNITLRDNLSECFEFIGSNLASEVQNGTIVWNIDSCEISKLNLKVKVKEGCGNDIINTVFIDGNKEGFNYSSSASSSIYIPSPVITSQQSPNWQWHRPSENNGLSSITITIKVQGKLRNVSVIDTLPDGSRLLNVSLTPTYEISNNTARLLWNLGDMENEVKAINLTMDFPNISNVWKYNYVYVKGQYSNGIAEHLSYTTIRVADYIDPVWVFVEPINDTRLPNDTVKFKITTILEANTTTKNVETLFTLSPEFKLITATGNFTIIKTDKTTLKWHVEGPFESGVNTTFTYEVIGKILGNTSPGILTANADAYSDVVDKIEEDHTNSTIIIPFCNGNCQSSEFCNKTINQCSSKKNNDNTCNASEECTSNNCFNGICRSVGWECNNDSDCSANYLCNNEHKCQIKSNVIYDGGNTGRNSGGGTQFITQIQPVTANKTNETVETVNKSAEKQNETKEKQGVTKGKILKIMLENKGVVAGEKFMVKAVDNDGNAVENVTVNYNGIIKFTDFEGKVEFVALKISIELKANKDGYKETNESKVTITPALEEIKEEKVKEDENSNGEKDKGKISEETNKTNQDDKLPLVMIAAIIIALVATLLLLKMKVFRKK
ncbi:exported hypothetical protein [groundwater metagenome]|uniref:Right handed beta helix domain-containing protein n=1 Tax=groundwater metagenome TaxID=717931 RepID=A0A098E6D0_9ZZZZ